jgi:hypothetical protein
MYLIAKFDLRLLHLQVSFELSGEIQAEEVMELRWL